MLMPGVDLPVKVTTDVGSPLGGASVFMGAFLGGAEIRSIVRQADRGGSATFLSIDPRASIVLQAFSPGFAVTTGAAPAGRSRRYRGGESVHACVAGRAGGDGASHRRERTGGRGRRGPHDAPGRSAGFGAIQALTDGEGRYVLPGLRPGTVQLNTFAAGFDGSLATLDLAAGSLVSVVDLRLRSLTKR